MFIVRPMDFTAPVIPIVLTAPLLLQSYDVKTDRHKGSSSDFMYVFLSMSDGNDTGVCVCVLDVCWLCVSVCW